MKIEVCLASNKNGFIIKNMYPLYLYDIAGIHGTLPNQYGIFEEGDMYLKRQIFIFMRHFY